MHTHTAETLRSESYHHRIYMRLFLLIPDISLLLQFVFFILIVPSLLLFSRSPHLSPPIPQSLHLISTLTTLPPAAMGLCILCIAKVVQPAADLASGHSYTQVPSALRHSHTKSPKRSRANTHPHYHIYEKLKKIFMMN